MNGSVGVLKQSTIANIPTIAQGTYITMGGTLYVVDTSDYTILGSVASGSNYIYLTLDGTYLTATWTQDISSYSWSNIYNYYSDGTNALLPYIINYDTYYWIGRFDSVNRQPLNSDSDIRANSFIAENRINGDGIKISGSNGVATITPKIEGDEITQRILSFDSAADYWEVRGGFGINGNLLPTASPTSGTQSLAQDATWTVPRGCYMWNATGPLDLSINGGTTYALAYYNGSIFSDGSNMIFKNTTSSTATITYKKF